MFVVIIVVEYAIMKCFINSSTLNQVFSEGHLQKDYGYRGDLVHLEIS